MRTADIVRVTRSPRRDCASDAAFVREAVFATQSARLYVAVASSRGGRHAVNEDGHTTLDGDMPLFVVADGVSSGAMAARASGDLVAHLHAALGEGPVDAEAVRRAVLDADRAIARSIARRTDAPGAATLALCAATDAALSSWLVAWVGDCRVYRLGTTDRRPAELLTRDDTYRHLDEASAHVVVAGAHGLNDLRDGHVEGPQAIGINLYLVLPDEAAQRSDLGYTRHGLQLIPQEPVLERA